MKNFTLIILSSILLSGCTVSSECGIQECHGLDITCGANVPKMCTEIYMLGDFCREYAKCSIINGACALEPSNQFTTCKNCVTLCNEQNTNDPMNAFDCENNCRTRMENCSETCPLLSTPGPEFCTNGTIVNGGVNECGCNNPPRCE